MHVTLTKGSTKITIDQINITILQVSNTKITTMAESRTHPPSMADLQALDISDALSWTRAEFEIPQARACGGDFDGEAVYFCGNSLGLLSKRGRQHLLEELNVWSTR